MILLDLLEIIDEGNDVKVIEYLTGITLAEYDGKNSIDEKYNLLDVISMNSRIEKGKDVIEIVVNDI